MYSKRIVPLLLCTSLSLAFLVSCGKKGTDNTDTATQSGASTVAEEEVVVSLEERLHNAEIKTIHDNGGTFIATVSYPVLQFDTLDGAVEAYARDTVSDFALESGEVEQYIDSSSPEYDPDVEMSEDLTISPFTMDSSYQMFIANNRYITVLITCSENLEAEAPIISMSSFVYDTETEALLSINDLFKPNSDGLARLSLLSNEMLTELNPEVPADLITTGTEPIAENFDCFALGEGGIRIFFPSGQSGDLTDGVLVADIPYAELADILAIDIPSTALTNDDILIESVADSNNATASDILDENSSFTESTPS